MQTKVIISEQRSKAILGAQLHGLFAQPLTKGLRNRYGNGKVLHTNRQVCRVLINKA